MIWSYSSVSTAGELEVRYALLGSTFLRAFDASVAARDAGRLHSYLDARGGLRMASVATIEVNAGEPLTVALRVTVPVAFAQEP